MMVHVDDQVVSGSLQGTTAGIRLQGGDLNPDHITDLLGREPTDSGVGGDVMEGSRFTGPSPAGWWHLLSDLPRSADAVDHIVRLLDQLTDDPEIWGELKRFNPDILCSIVVAGPEGFDVSPKVLGDLADRGITLTFDMSAARSVSPEM